MYLGKPIVRASHLCYIIELFEVDLCVLSIIVDPQYEAILYRES